MLTSQAGRMSEANVFMLRHLEDGPSELWQTAENIIFTQILPICHVTLELR